jgi:hypothetical protein
MAMNLTAMKMLLVSLSLFAAISAPAQHLVDKTIASQPDDVERRVLHSHLNL